MSDLKDTYAGQWSDDPVLLKKLLDAGNTVICTNPDRDYLYKATKVKEGYYFMNGCYWDDDEIESGCVLSGGFLVPPRAEVDQVKVKEEDLT